MKSIFLLPCLAACCTTFAQSTMPSTDIFIMKMSSNKAGKYSFSAPQNVTMREGYDNQPCFTANSKAILFTSIREDRQADVYRYNIRHKTTVRLTATPESEYSPTITPDGKYFSTVRVEKDSTQRLWKFPFSGEAPELILGNIDSVGYHCWIDNNILALFILTKPFSLYIGDLNNGLAGQQADNIGRSIQKAGGQRTLAYVDKKDSTAWMIHFLMLNMQKDIPVVKTLQGCEDFAVGKDGTLFMGKEGKLYKFTPEKDSDWEQIADFSKTVGNFYRIAISPNGKRIALVAYSGKMP